MEDLIFKYYLFATFALSMFKSAKKGATSEATSLFFIILGFISSAFFYKPSLKYILASIIIFFIVYTFGLFMAYKKEKHTFVEMILGMVIGFIKYFVLLTATTTIALILNSTTSSFEDIYVIKLIMPYAKKLALTILRIN